MKLKVWIFLAAALSIGTSLAAYFTSGFWQSLHFTLLSVFMSVGLGLAVVNGFLNEAERKKAAGVLIQMVAPSVTNYHNLFITKGQERFGIPAWNSIIDSMNANKRNPNALSKEQRSAIAEMIKANRAEIEGLLDQIDTGFRELTYILGWNFHPKIIRDAISSRLEVAQLRAAMSGDLAADADQKSAVENFFDVDAAVTAVLETLTTMLGIKMLQD